MNKKDCLFQLIKIMEILRSSKGCPWDKEQTLDDLKSYVLEEAYELLDAINSGSTSKIKEELGDLLFIIVFICKIFKEKKIFDIYDVAKFMNAKLIRRHPHVFKKKNIANSKEVLIQWEKIKEKEKDANEKRYLLESLPSNLPALLHSFKLTSKASLVGFDWNNVEEVWEKFEEELNEVKDSLGRKNKKKLEEEIGDLFFTLVNISRFYDINPEIALHKANQKFIKRFNFIEEKLKSQGKKFSDVDLKYLDNLWEDAKNQKIKKKKCE